MENNEATSYPVDGIQPMEKVGLSITSLILSIVGLLGSIFYTVIKIPAVASSLGDWVPNFSTNMVLDWVIFGTILAIFIACGFINDYLKKRRLGNPSYVKVSSLIYFIGLIVLLAGILMGFFIR